MSRVQRGSRVVTTGTGAAGDPIYLDMIQANLLMHFKPLSRKVDVSNPAQFSSRNTGYNENYGLRLN